MGVIFQIVLGLGLRGDQMMKSVEGPRYQQTPDEFKFIFGFVRFLFSYRHWRGLNPTLGARVLQEIYVKLRPCPLSYNVNA